MTPPENQPVARPRAAAPLSLWFLLVSLAAGALGCLMQSRAAATGATPPAAVAAAPFTVVDWDGHRGAGRSLRVTVRDGGALAQNGQPLARGAQGDYRVALDAGTLTFTR